VTAVQVTVAPGVPPMAGGMQPAAKALAPGVLGIGPPRVPSWSPVNTHSVSEVSGLKSQSI